MWMRWILLLLAPGLVASAWADETTALKRDLGSVVAAWNRKDFGTVIGWMPTRFIKTERHRAQALQEIKEGFASIDSFGLKTVTVKVQSVPPIQRHGALRSSVAVLIATAEGPGGTVVAKTHAMMASLDGEHWRVLPLFRMTDAEVNRVLPELGGLFHVPEPEMITVSIRPDLRALLGI